MGKPLARANMCREFILLLRILSDGFFLLCHMPGLHYRRLRRYYSLLSNNRQQHQLIKSLDARVTILLNQSRQASALAAERRSYATKNRNSREDTFTPEGPAQPHASGGSTCFHFTCHLECRAYPTPHPLHRTLTQP